MKTPYVLDNEERKALRSFLSAFGSLMDSGDYPGLNQIWMRVSRFEDVRSLNYFYHIEAMALGDNSPAWAMALVAKATLIRATQ